jgi:hypothetical protein
LLGGLVLLAFFVRVGFMPEVSLESVVSLLYAVALLGLGLMGLISGLVLPAVLLRHAIPWPQHRMTGGAFLLHCVGSNSLVHHLCSLVVLHRYLPALDEQRACSAADPGACRLGGSLPILG